MGMSREEAIRLLSGLMFKGKLKEALDMAIKALEQEPTTKNDLGVDREEAIETLKENLCAMCAYGSQCMESCDIKSCDNRDAIKALEQEPTTKDEHHRQNIQAYAHDFGVSEEQAEKELRVTTKNNLGVREFEGIEVTYPPEDICTYLEYKGKPYFGIKYKENGEEIVGYGTYNPEVLSRYLKDYFISTTTNDLAVDCISRADVNQVIEDYMDEQYNVLSDRTRERAFGAKVVMARINELSSVTPQEPFINKSCVSSGVCEHDKNEVLDKIRAEIEELDDKLCQQFLIEDADKEVHHAYQECLEIIDRYKAAK